MGKWKKLRVNAIKESFDQLPTAVCFFDNLGGIVLCNRQMYRLSQYLFQSDMQYLGEVKIALASPPDGVVRLSDMEDTYRFPDKTVWQFEWTKVTDRYGEVYTQLTAADITELHRALVQLADDNRKLDEDAKKLRELSENVEAVAKEKELLAAKSAMHDSLAASITVTKQYLAGDLGEVDAGMVLQEWEKSIAFREAALLSAKEKLFHDAKSSGVMVQMKGEEPKGSAADLMYVAMQVCLNNAIQYAQATELEINIWNNADNYTVMIGNNGKQPEQTIMEGGGLTNLRHRIEAAGGTMNVQSLPKFSLIIDIPKN
ncbi:ATP-binding protein [Faecalicatena sp. AGMB00832]|uniref:ATP-binding protein n=1 Tax=Faecalicatena faecalis TaxID=2726362 RepID=A0ABS6D888_9FIRM|nr:MULTISPECIES: ATP-binding protein [Faecalicatena]MCI6121581.1 ATP-binding protein [Lachnospiraceae bacterium]MCL6935641.1 ATP-binding protein [Clostridioides difficile]MBU3877809.1 ATP-binding protein [Faecalicatena faecalis]MCI6464560.1 ATP-binding protein [Faecalicatena sp.]MDY5620088.1 ATP-binding protein [Lachnospiraceae bacterium]